MSLRILREISGGVKGLTLLNSECAAKLTMFAKNSVFLAQKRHQKHIYFMRISPLWNDKRA